MTQRTAPHMLEELLVENRGIVAQRDEIAAYLLELQRKQLKNEQLMRDLLNAELKQAHGFYTSQVEVESYLVVPPSA